MWFFNKHVNKEPVNVLSISLHSHVPPCVLVSLICYMHSPL